MSFKNLFDFIKIFFVVTIFSVLVGACGNPVVDIEEIAYEPKIVVEGFLYPGSNINKLKITRNFELNTDVDPSDLFLLPSQNNVKASINGISLNFDSPSNTYFSDEVTVEFNKTYELEVEAVVDGRQLRLLSQTTTPQKGFNILQKDLGTKIYSKHEILFDFAPSPEINLYAFSIVPDSASLDNFIWENSFFPNPPRDQIEENFNNFLFQFRILANLNSFSTEPYIFKVEDFDAWFYSRYRVIGYAGDQNYKDYLFTSKNVKEFDGNFHEPKSHFKGDGIGVFASAIRDTVYFDLVK